MDPRNLQPRKILQRLRKKFKPKGDEPDLQSRVEQQRSAAQGVGVNPFALRWSGQERGPMAMVLRKTSPCLPKELRDEIIGFASKAKFIQDFGIDMDTAKEIEQILDRAPKLKAAMDEISQLLGRLGDGGLKEREALTSIAEKISSSPDASVSLKQCVKTNTQAIRTATTEHDEFKAANKFMSQLAAFGIRRIEALPDQT
jgi:hypothetical protein